MALRACTYVSKKEKIGCTSWEMWTATIVPDSPIGLRPVRVFLYACVEEESNETLGPSPIMTIASLLPYDIWKGTCVCVFFCMGA